MCGSPGQANLADMSSTVVSDLTLGTRFALALAAKQRDRLVALLGEPLDFGALTPGRHWASTAAAEVVDEFVLGRWFGPGNSIEGLDDVVTGRVGSREHVGYRLRVRRDDVLYAVEQQAYYDVDQSGRMSYVRLVCSGYCPLG
jgi:hypothetical protein